MKDSSMDELIPLVTEKNSEEEVIQIIRNHGRRTLAACEVTYLQELVENYGIRRLIKSLIDSECKLDNKDSSGMTQLVNALISVKVDKKVWDQPASQLFRAYIKKTIKSLFGENKRLYPRWFMAKVRFIIIREIVAKIRERNVTIERLGEILSVTCCRIDDIVHFENLRLTEAYLQSFSKCFFYENSDAGLRILMKSADLRHLKLIIHHLYDLSRETYNLFNLLMEFLPRYHKSKAGRAFVKGLLRLDIFNERSLYHLQWSLMSANEESLVIFLKYEFRSIVKAKCGIDIFPSIFGSKHVDASSLLKNEQMDIETRGYYNYTPLHFAAEYNSAINIKSLLERNANIYALDGAGRTPLEKALRKVGEHEAPDIECVRLLLLAGTDPLFVNKNNDFFGVCPFDLVAERFGMDIIELFAGQLAIYEVLGLPVEQSLKCFSEFDDPELKRFFEECRRQLQLMKTHEIRDNPREFRSQEFTMFTILSGEDGKISRYINEQYRQAIAKFMNEYRKEAIVPYYYEILDKRIENINQMNLCRSKAMSIISKCTGIDDVHHLVVDKIVNYLTKKDLLMFKNDI